MAESQGDRMNGKVVIYHGGGCRDGFCAAWVLHGTDEWKDARYVPAQYGDDPPDVAGCDVMIVDFSYPREVLLRMASVANSVVVLDHHASAERHLDGLAAPNLTIWFNKDQSGASWAHKWAMENTAGGSVIRRMWPIVAYVQDRDLWAWKLPYSREVNAAIRSYPLDFEEWDELMITDISELRCEGETVLRVENQIVDSHVRYAGIAEIGGHRVPCVNATVLQSEIAGKLAVGQPFAACYFEKADGARVFSLRSEPAGLDVSKIAEEFGGGGHKHAAGFTMAKDEPSVVPLDDAEADDSTVVQLGMDVYHDAKGDES